MKAFKLPDFDVYAIVKDSTVGTWLSEIALDGDAIRTVEGIIEAIDDETVAVVRVNLSEGSITDVSEDVAQAWMKSAGLHHEWNINPVPPLVDAHCGDDVEHQCQVAVWQAEENTRYRSQERAYHQSAVL